MSPANPSLLESPYNLIYSSMTKHEVEAALFVLLPDPVDQGGALSCLARARECLKETEVQLPAFQRLFLLNELGPVFLGYARRSLVWDLRGTLS